MPKLDLLCSTIWKIYGGGGGVQQSSQLIKQQSFHKMSAILAAILDISKILFCAKIVENMCLQPQIRI